MRLIDADNLNFEGQRYSKMQLLGILEFVEKQPTAYDVEAVVAKLENASYRTESTFDEDGYCNDDSEEVVALDRANEIVRDGGKEAP